MNTTIPTYQLNTLTKPERDVPAVFFMDHETVMPIVPIHLPYRSNYYKIGVCLRGSATMKCLIVLWLAVETVLAQPTDTTGRQIQSAYIPQQDIADVAHTLLPRWKRIVPHDSARLNTGGRFIFLAPQVGYTLQTSFLAQVLANVTFQRPGANVSTLVGSAAYTLNNQTILSLTNSVWNPQNRLVWMGDWRLMHYPQGTFGLGIINTSLNREISMDYEYLRVYQKVLKRIAPNLYAGLGYALDLHWNIVSRNRNREVVQISRYRYGVEGRSVSSGPLFSLLYDSRPNSINASRGYFVNLQYRPNMQLLGSDVNYQTLLLEGRTYLRPFPNSPGVFAFWSYNALTLNGNPPFLDLPSTGWDTYSNTGRGYVQGRFRGKNLLYLETEYRFNLTRNQFLGGVVFANAQTVTEAISGTFQRVAPAVGTGLRLKMNKFSRTNLAIDYAFGSDGSRGLFFNFGEVF